jgi:hypothetical protein
MILMLLIFGIYKDVLIYFVNSVSLVLLTIAMLNNQERLNA